MEGGGIDRGRKRRSSRESIEYRPQVTVDRFLRSLNRRGEGSPEVLKDELLLPLLFQFDGADAQVCKKETGKKNGDEKHRYYPSLPSPMGATLWHSLALRLDLQEYTNEDRENVKPLSMNVKTQ